MVVLKRPAEKERAELSELQLIVSYFAGVQKTYCTQTSHIKNGICTSKNQYFNSQKITALELVVVESSENRYNNLKISCEGYSVAELS